MKRWLATLFAALAGTALLAAACAPASEPKPAQPETTKPETQTGTQVQQKPPAQQQAQPSQPAIPAAEQNAKAGGVLITPTTLAAPGYVPWEEAVTTGMAPVHPQSNWIVHYGTAGDYAAQDYWKIVGDLAKSWEQSADGLKWTFKFHDGVKWSDGQPFTCEDARWSVDTIRTGQGLRRSPRAVQFKAVDKIECPDGLTLVISLKRPQNAFLEVLAMGPNSVWPKHVYEGEAGLKKLREEPKHVGTGPFFLKEFIPGEKYVFEKNPDYWKKPYPFLDGIEIPFIATNAVPPALRAGRVHMGATGTAFAGAQADTLQKECKDCQFWPRFTHIGFTALQVNFQRPPWNTPEVREAFGYAIDQKKLVDVGAQGWGIPGVGIIHPDSPYRLPESLVKSIPGHDLSNPQANRDKAKAALAKGGYKPGELTVKIPVWAGVISPIMPPLIEDLEAAGIKVAPTDYETARMYDLMSAGDFDVVPWGFFLTAWDPDITLYEHFYTGSDRNYGRYSSPEVDRLIDQQSATLDPEQRKKLIQQVSEIIMKDQGKLVVYWYQYMPITGPEVKNFLPGPTCTSHGPCFRYERVWLDKK